MTYCQTGLRERPRISWLRPALERIMSLGATRGEDKPFEYAPGWEGAVTSALTGKDVRPESNRRLVFVESTELNTIAGNEHFPLGSPAMHDLLMVVSLIFKEAGIWKEMPAMIEERESHYLSIDECVRLILDKEITFRSLASLGGEQNAKWGTFCALLPNMISDMHKVFREEKMLVMLLRKKVQSIGWSIWRGQRPVGLELSFFLSMAPQGDHTFREGVEDNLLAWPDGLDTIAEIFDPAVVDAWNRFKAVAEAGPYSRYFKLLYNRRDDGSTSYYLGPAPRDIPVFVGFAQLKGPVTVYSLSQAFTIPWSDAQTLDAIKEREARISIGEINDPFVIEPPVATISTQSIPPWSSLDEDCFELYFRDDFRKANSALPKISQFDVRYQSSMMGRVLDTWLGTFGGPTHHIYDVIFSNGSFGGGQYSNATIADFPKICESLSDFNFEAQKDPSATPGLVFCETPILQIPVYIPNPALNTVDEYIISFSESFGDGGTLLAVSGGREHLILPKSVIKIAEPRLLSHVTSQLGLTPAEQKIANQAIEVSITYGLFEIFLEDWQMPTTTPQLVAATSVV